MQETYVRANLVTPLSPDYCTCSSSQMRAAVIHSSRLARKRIWPGNKATFLSPSNRTRTRKKSDRYSNCFRERCGFYTRGNEELRGGRRNVLDWAKAQGKNCHDSELFVAYLNSHFDYISRIILFLSFSHRVIWLAFRKCQPQVCAFSFSESYFRAPRYQLLDQVRLTRGCYIVSIESYDGIGSFSLSERSLNGSRDGSRGVVSNIVP